MGASRARWLPVRSCRVVAAALLAAVAPPAAMGFQALPRWSGAPRGCSSLAHGQPGWGARRCARGIAGAQGMGMAISSLPPLAIACGDKWTLWAVISGAALVGIRSENTAVGRALSGAVVSMLAASSLAVLGILPSQPAPAITGLQAIVVALATPLLLLSADLSVILQRTGLMLRAFVCGAIGTALGSVLGFWLVRVHHAA